MTQHDSKITRRARIHFRNGHSVQPAAIPALSPQDIEDLKFIACSRTSGSVGKWYQTTAALRASRILARHGIVTNFNRNTGRITFS